MYLKFSNSFLSFLNAIKNYSSLLDKNDKKKTFYMLVLIIIGTLLEMLSISIIFPMIQIVLNENFINEYSSLKFIETHFHLHKIR